MLDTEIPLGVKCRIKMGRAHPSWGLQWSNLQGPLHSLPPESLLIPTTWKESLHFIDNVKQITQPSIPRKGQRKDSKPDVSDFRPRYFYCLTSLSIYREDFSPNTKQLSTSTPR